MVGMDFTENLEDPDILVHTHISQEDSDSERPTKVEKNSNVSKHSIYSHFQKNEIATYA